MYSKEEMIVYEAKKKMKFATIIHELNSERMRGALYYFMLASAAAASYECVCVCICWRCNTISHVLLAHLAHTPPPHTHIQYILCNCKL